MAKYSPHVWQNCATCEFWQGPREVDTVHTIVETDETTRGSCTLRGSHQEKYATSTCIGWRKWRALTV